MKLILFLIILLAISSSLTNARKYLKCGYIDSKCVKVKKDGKCPTEPICPSGFKRKLIENGCCCVLRDSIQGKAVNPELVNVDKKKILNKTLNVIVVSYEEAMRQDEVPMIDTFGKIISEAMKRGIKKLSKMVDLRFDDVLRHIFDDEFDDFNEHKMNLIESEVNEIFETGNEALENISKRVAGILLENKKV